MIPILKKCSLHKILKTVLEKKKEYTRKLSNILNKMSWKFPLCYILAVTSNCIYKIPELYNEGTSRSHFTILLL